MKTITEKALRLALKQESKEFGKCPWDKRYDLEEITETARIKVGNLKVRKDVQAGISDLFTDGDLEEGDLYQRLWTCKVIDENGEKFAVATRIVTRQIDY